jgi:hypothetical protein
VRWGLLLFLGEGQEVVSEAFIAAAEESEILVLALLVVAHPMLMREIRLAASSESALTALSIMSIMVALMIVAIGAQGG